MKKFFAIAIAALFSISMGYAESAPNAPKCQAGKCGEGKCGGGKAKKEAKDTKDDKKEGKKKGKEVDCSDN